MPKFKYGDEVRDTLTNTVGSVTGYAHYYGMETDAYLIEYKNATGTLIKDWVNVNRLVLVDEFELPFA